MIGAATDQRTVQLSESSALSISLLVDVSADGTMSDPSHVSFISFLPSAGWWCSYLAAISLLRSSSFVVRAAE